MFKSHDLSTFLPFDPQTTHLDISPQTGYSPAVFPQGTQFFAKSEVNQ